MKFGVLCLVVLCSSPVTAMLAPRAARLRLAPPKARLMLAAPSSPLMFAGSGTPSSPTMPKSPKNASLLARLSQSPIFPTHPGSPLITVPYQPFSVHRKPAETFSYARVRSLVPEGFPIQQLLDEVHYVVCEYPDNDYAVKAVREVVRSIVLAHIKILFSISEGANAVIESMSSVSELTRVVLSDYPKLESFWRTEGPLRVWKENARGRAFFLLPPLRCLKQRFVEVDLPDLLIERFFELASLRMCAGACGGEVEQCTEKCFLGCLEEFTIEDFGGSIEWHLAYMAHVPRRQKRWMKKKYIHNTARMVAQEWFSWQQDSATFNKSVDTLTEIMTKIIFSA